MSRWQFPRANIEAAFARQELQKPGIYFLVGQDEEADVPLVYIGEAEISSERLKTQNSSQDFWTHALVVNSKTESFTKAHVRYLEWFCCEKAKEANRFRLKNSNSPKKPYAPFVIYKFCISKYRKNEREVFLIAINLCQISLSLKNLNI